MAQVLLDIAMLVGGFILLAKGADWLVQGSSEIARQMGIRPLVLGLTVVAWGTSAPELVVSGLAASEGRAGISLGNVLGSNIANLGLVLGTCALILPTVLHRFEAREVFWLLVSLGVVWWRTQDFDLSRIDGLWLVGTFAIYNLHLYVSSRRHVAPEEAAPHSDRPKTAVVLGIAGVAIGAKLIVEGAISLAEMAGISERVIALTIIAIGTSLPELAAGIGSAIRKQSDLSLGNVVGSNVFNVLPVFGAVAFIAPIRAESPQGDMLGQSLSTDMPVVLGFTVAAILLPWIGARGKGRWRGGTLLLAYVAYMAYLFGAFG